MITLLVVTGLTHRKSYRDIFAWRKVDLICSQINVLHQLLAGYEVREYLLEKWGRVCAYCDATGTPLQIEHIVAKSRGGSNGSATTELDARTRIPRPHALAEPTVALTKGCKALRFFSLN